LSITRAARQPPDDVAHTLSLRHASSAVLLVLWSTACGCCFHKDLTKSALATEAGLLGRRLRTTEQLELVKDTHTRRLFLAERDYPFSTRDQRVGVVDPGTELRVNRLERVRELFAILVFLPEYYSWNCTLAEIQGGPYAGREVAVDGQGLLLKIHAATTGGRLLVFAPARNAALGGSNETGPVGVQAKALDAGAGQPTLLPTPKAERAWGREAPLERFEPATRAPAGLFFGEAL